MQGTPSSTSRSSAIPTQTDSVLRYSITGNTLEFYRNGRAESISGAVRVSYYYVRPGYDGVLVADSSVDIYDNDAPMVIVKQTDGSTDVIERAQNASDVTDYYTIELSKAPAQDVTITVDPSPTRTVLDGRALFQEQVEVSLTGNPGTWFSSLEVVFSPNAQAANGWNKPVKIYVRALFDTVLDGSDNQVFAPEAHTVNKIRGPLLLEGAAGSGSLSLPAPLMLPGEINLRPSDGTVQGFTPATTAEGFEYVKVKMSDLQKLIDDATKKFDNLADFIDKTFELTEGPGTGVVLDAGRPRDLFDRFWLIKEVQDVVGDSSSKLLKLQNPTAVDPTLPNVIAPTTASKFAITNLSVNFFADERTQVDYTTVFDEDSVANDKGRLTSADGNVLAFQAVDGTTDKMTVETGDLLALNTLLGYQDFAWMTGKTLTVTVGPGIDRTWTIGTVVDGAVAGTKVLTLTRVSGSTDAPTDRSEYRIEGGDRKGRITGLGMGPNVIIGGTVQPGGITYGDMEVMLVKLGSGNDEVTVDYATNAEDHVTKRSADFYTLTTLQSGKGGDKITVALKDGEDGAFSLETGAGDDMVDGSASTLPLVVFGGDGDDSITTGAGDDIVFGDTGRVDYLDKDGLIVTRLGHSIPQNPVNPPVPYRVSSSTATTLVDNDASYVPGSLVGFTVQVTAPNGVAEIREITANTDKTITVAAHALAARWPEGFLDPPGRHVLLPHPVQGRERHHR